MMLTRSFFLSMSWRERATLRAMAIEGGVTTSTLTEVYGVSEPRHVISDLRNLWRIPIEEEWVNNGAGKRGRHKIFKLPKALTKGCVDGEEVDLATIILRARDDIRIAAKLPKR